MAEMHFYYVNGKRQTKELTVSDHARARLQERWSRVRDFLGADVAAEHASGFWGQEIVNYMTTGDTDTLIGLILAKGHRWAPKDWSNKQRERSHEYPHGIYFFCRF